MLQAAKEFRIGRPQILAGLMLLGFLAQCFWVGGGRKLSDLEYQYIGSGLSRETAPEMRAASPITGWMAALAVGGVRVLKGAAPARWSAYLAIPRPWLLRMPFTMFGLWLGGALWWVARRLFDDAGGYVALGLYCSSPAMVMISSNIGPEIILAWSFFGLIYTAIGVAHTLYAPPRKWAPRILILGLSVGFGLAASLWSVTLILPAMAFMIYLAPGRRRSVLMVLLGSGAVATLVYGFFFWWSGVVDGHALTVLRPQITLELVRNLMFVFGDGYALVAMFLAALTAYLSWRRARYFGNTAPLLTAFIAVLLFALVPAIHLWTAVLGLSFVFVFIGGVAADLLETSLGRYVAAALAAGFLLRIVLTTRTLDFWKHWSGLNHL
jgi:Dolichyl-phosphate-mannose-protein mannosyltransferase